MPLFKLKKSGRPRDLELSMAGLKLGKFVLQLDGGDTGLIAALATDVGLSGLACAVARTPEQAQEFERAAAKSGVLVEVKTGQLTSLPYDDGVFDLLVAKHVLGELSQNERVACLQQAFRVLKNGGRCLVIDPAMRGGLGAFFTRQSLDERYIDGGGAQQALKAEGFRGVRLLAERDGMTFVEGTKPVGTQPGFA